MQTVSEIHTLTEAEEFIHDNPLAFFYISRPNCSVCHGLLPQVLKLLEKYPKIKKAHINLAELEAIAGKFSIFTVPVLLLFVNGKETIREARIVHLDLLEQKMDKIYTLFQ